uniref:Uncharacterized protein n=1 Tax=Siphoviridae sp. ctMAv2 TaxID=2826258 RepID=A0A8S5LSZ5_9CAUD|nr:MAG TPA: hypothetical protein [Siphoviridae sp. ctMAv2]
MIHFFIKQDVRLTNKSDILPNSIYLCRYHTPTQLARTSARMV